jgi:hypothetical protein
MSTRSISLVLACLLFATTGGFVAGRWTAPTTPGSDPLRKLEQTNLRAEALLEKLEAAHPMAPGRVVAAGFDDPALRREIRQILQEELRGHMAQADAKRDEVEQGKDGEDAEDEDESKVAYERGQNLVKTALANRSWDRRQGLEMRVLLSTLTNEQRKAVLDELFGAISRGEIVSEGPPL